MSSSMIVLEFNELCPSLIDRFIDEGKLPNFKRLREESDVFITEAEENPPNLEPWIQWITVHSGLTFREHGVFHLGDGDKLKVKNVWDLVSDSGRKVWVCGSMNLRYDAPVDGFVLPDPWSAKQPPTPAELNMFYRFVQQNVLEHSNEKVPLSKSDYMNFLLFMVSHGLSLRSVRAIMSQLWRERRGQRWRRAFLLDHLQFDLFRSVYQRIKPAFSTFFLNSTAHMQHMYWRNFEPGVFQRQPTEAEQAEYASAIETGYREMDAMVGRFLTLAGPDVILVLSTALSQQPCLIYEEQGGKFFYRPRNFENLLAFAGVPSGYKVAPVMAEQFHVYFANEQEASKAAECLNALVVDRERAMSVRREGRDVFTGCTLFRKQQEGIALNSTITGKSAPFFDIFYEVSGIKSGMHHRDGVFWVRHGKRHVMHSEKVPLNAVAPSLLLLLGIEPPSYMRGAPLDIVGAKESSFETANA